MKIREKIEKYFILIISILFLFISFIMSKENKIRIILCLLFIVGTTFYFYKQKKIKKNKLPIFLLLLFITTLLGDAVFSYIGKRIPIFSYNITTMENTRVYNAFGITVWQCNKEDYKNVFVVPFYKKGYLCELDNKNAIFINDFFKAVVDSYEEYQNTQIKIKGKISKIGGKKYIEMQPYKEENGEIIFDTSSTLSILFNSEEDSLNSYTLYDDIEVIGTIKNREITKEGIIIYLYETYKSK